MPVWHEAPSRPEHDGQRGSGSPQSPATLLGFYMGGFDGFSSMVLLSPPFPEKMMSRTPCKEAYLFSRGWEGCRKQGC